MNLSIIQKSIDYIEDNLKTDITAKELSEMAGFYKAFVREFGYTPTQFLNMSKKRKPYRINLLKEEHIMVSHKKIKEVLQNWGLEHEKLSDVVYDETGVEKHISLPQQIIHRDPNPGNLILKDDNWGVLDFDLSERNLRIFDPCYAATAILSESFEAYLIMSGKRFHRWLLQIS